MTRADEQRLVIAGGGLAGCLAALALAERRPEIPLLLLEQGKCFGGNHIWSFFDTDVADSDRWLIDPLVCAHWDGYEVSFPRRTRILPTGYNSIRSERLDKVVRDRLGEDRYRLECDIASVDADGVTLRGGERIAARGVIDARGADNLQMLDLGWQKFVGRDYVLAAPHGLDRPVVMDATVDQAEGYRFVYCLPFSETRILVEDTYYSTDPGLNTPRTGTLIEQYLRDRGWSPVVLEKEETGVLPVAMGGDFDAFWPWADRAVPRLGLRGGFFHPTTGYSLPDAVRTALLMTRQTDFSSAALHRLYRGLAARLWRQRAFYRLLNRMLFRAAAPTERYRVLEHFYRLDPGLIARFYAGRSNIWDKLRIISGKPPVPLASAIGAIGRTGA